MKYNILMKLFKLMDMKCRYKVLITLHLLIIFMLTSISCREMDRILSLVEELTWSHPDSALNLLKDIPDSSLLTQSDRAIKQVLLSETLYKLGYDETNDSNISMAVAFFDDDLKSRYRAKAYFYKGFINNSNQKYSDALISLLNAEKSALLAKDTLLSGLIHRSLGDVYYGFKDYIGSLNYYKIGYSELENQQNGYYKGDALYDVARAYYNAEKYDSCKIVSKFILEQIESGNLDLNKRYVLNLLAGNEYRMGNYEESKRYYDEHLALGHPYLHPLDIYMLGGIYIEKNELGKAKELEKILERKDSTKLWLKMSIRKAEKDYEGAAFLLDKMLEQQNAIYSRLSTQNQTAIVKEYYLAEENRKNAQLAESRNVTIWITVSCILAVALILIVFRNKLRKLAFQRDLDRLKSISFKEMIMQKEEEIDDLTDQCKRIQSELDSLQQKIHDKEELVNQKCDEIENKNSTIETERLLKKKLEKDRERLISELEQYAERLKLRDEAADEAHKFVYESISARFDLFNEICDLFNQYRDRPDSERLFYKSVTKLIYDNVNDKKIRNSLQRLVDTKLGNLITDFQRDMPNLKNEDYLLYLYLVLRFTSTTISVLLNVKVETIYTRRRNLILKIKKNCATNPDRYLSYLQKIST